MNEFNKANIKSVRKEIEDALAVLEKAGISFNLGTINYSEDQARVTLTVKPKAYNAAMNKRTARVIAAGVADEYMTSNDLFNKYSNHKCLINGKLEDVKEFKSRNTKMPFIVGKYKLSREQFLSTLQK